MYNYIRSPNSCGSVALTVESNKTGRSESGSCRPSQRASYVEGMLLLLFILFKWQSCYHVSRTRCLFSSVVSSRPLFIYLVPSIISSNKYRNVFFTKKRNFLIGRKRIFKIGYNPNLLAEDPPLWRRLVGKTNEITTNSNIGNKSNHICTACTITILHNHENKFKFIDHAALKLLYRALTFTVNRIGGPGQSIMLIRDPPSRFR